MQALEDTLRKPSPEEQLDEINRQRAAVRIQKTWRKRMRKKYLGPDFLWSDLATHARMKIDRDAAEEGKNTSRDRWRRGAFLAGRLQDGNDMLSSRVEGVSHAEATRKHLETQHWLELIDGKHRYGSNLKYYHERWRREDTTENFFRWLDHGGGKGLSLRECPREQLENERITYLSSEQRLNYLVTIDNSGKLRWTRNGQLVDTTSGRWKDAGDGKGIVPFEDPAPGSTSIPRHSFTAPPPNSASLSRSDSSLSRDQADAVMHYVGLHRESKNPIKRVLLKNFTLRGLLEKLLRKTVKRNTWIYVSDKNFNIFIGIKAPGTFQHSSFLAGGLVTSAGLISVKDGMIHTLSPLSGHYRTSIEHFRKFISVLDERGVDMSKVEISKAEIAMWGIEHLGKFKRKQAEMIKHAKQETSTVAKQVASTVGHRDQNGDQDWKRDILEGRKRRRPQDDDPRHGEQCHNDREGERGPVEKETKVQDPTDSHRSGQEQGVKESPAG